MNTNSDNSTGEVDNTIQSLSAQSVDGNRVRVKVELAENHSRPNLMLILNDAEEQEVTHSIIMGSVDRNVEFTLHVRIQDPPLPLSFTCVSYIEEDIPLDTKNTTVQ